MATNDIFEIDKPHPTKESKDRQQSSFKTNGKGKKKIAAKKSTISTQENSQLIIYDQALISDQHVIGGENQTTHIVITPQLQIPQINQKTNPFEREVF